MQPLSRTDHSLPTSMVRAVPFVADVLTSLGDGHHLIIEVGDENRYVQYATYGPNLRGESASNRYIDGDPLDEADLAWLSGHGWNDPDDGGNHWRHWEPADPLAAATMGIVTMHRIHGAKDPSELSFHATEKRELELLESFTPPPKTITVWRH